MSAPLTLALLALLPFALALVCAYWYGRHQRQREVRRELERNWPR